MFAHQSQCGSGQSALISSSSDSAPYETIFTSGTQPVGPQNARKRKRNTIACFQCRARKRRCEATFYAECESCVREGLECRLPDTDGRKIRWQKSTASSVPADPEHSKLLASNSAAKEDGAVHDGADIDSTYLDSLFELIIGSGSAHVDSSSLQAGPSDLSTAPSVKDRDVRWTQASGGISDAGQQSGLATQDGNHILDRFPNLLQAYPSESPDLSWMASLPTPPNQHQIMSSSHLSKEDRVSPRSLIQPSYVKKVVWWRSHGPSAIAPGLKRITLKVRFDKKVDPTSPASPLQYLGQNNPTPSDNLVDEGGMPRRDLMLHLLDVFMEHFGCQYPALSLQRLKEDLDRRSGSTLLFNCIASTASRFSNHPALALPGLEPHAYGSIFLKTAKDMLGNMMAVPTRDTVIALTLLAGICHGVGSESEEWMMAGMAVRMAIDLGFHLAHPPQSSMSVEDQRLDRLTFWSVYFLDMSLSFGVGRETAFRIASVTQTIPTESDFENQADGPVKDVMGLPTSGNVFTHAAKLAFIYGPLVNVVNGPRDDPTTRDQEIQRITQHAVEEYNALPQELQWSAYNLQNLSKRKQGSIFVQMHLWMHTILASGYLIGTDVVRPERTGFQRGNTTPSNATATRLWQNSARTIGDILILCDIVNPFAYHALPFSNQPFVVAGCCYIKEADAQHQIAVSSDDRGRLAEVEAAPTSVGHVALDGDLSGRTQTSTNSREEKAEIYWTLLRSVVSNNIATLQQGLKRQTRYWAGVAWVAEVLAQRISGVKMNEIDLEQVTKSLDSTVTVPDARMFGPEGDVAQMEFAEGQTTATAPFDVQLPLEVDWMADSALLQSTGYSVMVENFTSDWATNGFR